MLLIWAALQGIGGFNPALEYNPDPTLGTAANFAVIRSAIAANKWTAAAQTAPAIQLGGTNSAVTTAALKAGTYRFSFTIAGWTQSGGSMTCVLDVGGSNASNSVVISDGNGLHTCDVILAADATFNNFKLSTLGTNTWGIGPISLKRIA